MINERIRDDINGANESISLKVCSVLPVTPQNMLMNSWASVFGEENHWSLNSIWSLSSSSSLRVMSPSSRPSHMYYIPSSSLSLSLVFKRDQTTDPRMMSYQMISPADSKTRCRSERASHDEVMLDGKCLPSYPLFTHRIPFPLLLQMSVCK